VGVYVAQVCLQPRGQIPAQPGNSVRICGVGALASVASSYRLDVLGSSEAVGESAETVPGDLLSASCIGVPAICGGFSVLLSSPAASSAGLPCLLRWRRNQTARATMAMPARPPTTPPAMAAVGVLEEEEPLSELELESELESVSLPEREEPRSTCESHF
jgi:hypothetical protein